jgi:hypothetical protein
MGIAAVQNTINGFDKGVRIVDIIKEEGNMTSGGTYTYKNPDSFLVITEADNEF